MPDPVAMPPSPLTVTIPHQLGRAEARRRMEEGFANLVRQVPGSGGGALSQRWEGDRLTFRFAALGQAIAGTVTVQDTTVTIAVELPGALGMIASGLAGRLRKAGQLLLTKR